MFKTTSEKKSQKQKLETRIRREGNREEKYRHELKSGEPGAGSFFLACEDLGRMFDNSFPA